MGPRERFENYEVCRHEDGSLFELGRGGMGVTYKAWDTDLHCDVALKVIHPGILDNADSLARFLREARAAARLRHPNIASVFRLGRAGDDTHYYAMEYCPGPTLEQAIGNRGPLPTVEALRIVLQVSKALTVAEKYQILHRDLKPANLILSERSDEELVVKVIDFGLAKSLAAGHAEITAPAPDRFVGTAYFASPEQLEEGPLDIRSDIYSLGVCLWYMLTGRPIFEGPFARVMSQVLNAEPPWEKLAAQPTAVTSLLRRLLAKDREYRPSTAVELRQEVEESLRAVDSQSGSHGSAESPSAARSTARGALSEQEFSQRYSMSARLARDGLGRIFQARDMARGGRVVTVRVLDASTASLPGVGRELERQLSAALAHPHPHLVSVLDFTTARQGKLVAMETTDGFTLLEVLKHRGALNPAEVLTLIGPLATAADHASRHSIHDIDLSKERVTVHFPAGMSEADRARLPAVGVESWPEHIVKAEILSPGHLNAQQDGGLQSMMTVAVDRQAVRAGASSSTTRLAILACELLGARLSGDFAPIPRLSEAGNATLRQGLEAPTGFAGTAAFVEALQATIGKRQSFSYRPQATSSPAMPAAALPAVALPAAPPSAAAPRWGRILRVRLPAVAAGVALLVGGWGYYAGIHRPRVLARSERRNQAEAASRTPVDLPAAAERLKIEARKVESDAANARMRSEAAAQAEAREKERNPAPAPVAMPAPSLVPESPPKVVPGKPPGRPAAFRDATLEKEELSPSGKIRVKYWLTDAIRRIVLENADDPDQWSLLFEHQRNASAVVAPNDQYLVVNNHPTTSGGGAQLYRQVTANPPQYVVVAGYQGEGNELQDRAWAFYLASTGRKPDSDRDHVLVDGKSWSADSQSLTIRIVGGGSNHDRSVPTPWECAFNVGTQQFRALSPSNNAGPSADQMAGAVRAFVEKADQDEASRDLSRIMPNYAATVDYYELGMTTVENVRKDKQKYFVRWPRARQNLKGDVTILGTESGRIRIQFTTAFRVDGPKGEWVEGETVQTETLVWDNGFRIVSEKGTVTQRTKGEGPGPAVNEFNLANGRYQGSPAQPKSGDLARLETNNYFVINGKRFTFFRVTNYIPTPLGRSSGNAPYSFGFRYEGTITRGQNGLLNFTPTSVVPQDSNLPAHQRAASINDLNAARKALSGATWKLTLREGNLFEPGTGNVWVPVP